MLSLNQKFDLIIIDAPCTNTGVLNKRPEARWRLSALATNLLKETQKKLIQNAKRMLSKNGEIWFLTCSILKEENEDLIDEVCLEMQMKKRASITILPSEEGDDGGFASAITPD